MKTVVCVSDEVDSFINCGLKQKSPDPAADVQEKTAAQSLMSSGTF